MTSLQVALNRLRHFVASHDSIEGARLPSERALAETLGISRTLLRDALAVIESEALIWRHVGKGTFIGGRPIRKQEELSSLSGLTSPSEIMEVRLIVEPHAAAQAALRATQPDLKNLRRCLAKLESASNHRNYARWDSELHRTIVSASHNSLLLAIFSAVNAVRVQAGFSNAWEGSIIPSRRKSAQIQHQRIVQSIVERKPQDAFASMRKHILHVQNWVFGLEEIDSPDLKGPDK